MTFHRNFRSSPWLRPCCVVGCLWVLVAWIPVIQASPIDPAGSGTGGFAEEVKKASSAIKSSVQNLAGYGTLAGQQGFLARVLISREEAKLLYKTVEQTVHFEDLLLIVLIGWTTVPVLKIPYEKLMMQRPFGDTALFVLADHLQQIAKIATLVYLTDILQLYCVGLGFDFCKMGNVPHAFAQAAYTVWGAQRLAAIKKYLLRRYVSHHPETYGRMQIFNRLLDAAIYAAGILVTLNLFKVEMGVAMHSFLAFGSVGTLAVGLASQGITTQILNGLMLASSDRIYEGDSVKFGNGQSGTIVKLGWLETVLRGSDEVMVSIPNTDLLKQQVSNLSRIRYCQVKQTLKIKYKDAEKVPGLLDMIKQEIRVACPSLITDGTRPFRAYWTDFTPESALEIMVDAHFYLKPIGDEYFSNRMQVLQAIDRAVRNQGVTLVEI